MCCELVLADPCRLSLIPASRRSKVLIVAWAVSKGAGTVAGLPCSASVLDQSRRLPKSVLPCPILSAKTRGGAASHELRLQPTPRSTHRLLLICLGASGPGSEARVRLSIRYCSRPPSRSQLRSACKCAAHHSFQRALAHDADRLRSSQASSHHHS